MDIFLKVVFLLLSKVFLSIARKGKTPDKDLVHQGGGSVTVLIATLRAPIKMWPSEFTKLIEAHITLTYFRPHN